MCFHFRAEVFEHIADWDGGGLAESAIGGTFHFISQIQQGVQFLKFALSL